jgi:hypothetical protein
MNYKAAYLSAPYEMKLKDVGIRDIQDDQILVKDPI